VLEGKCGGALENYMQERFLVSGKAGSGKTHLVLQKYSRFIEEHKEDNVIFILPTHSQVEHLRNHILRTSEFKGYLDTGLVTFSILANKILDSVDSTPPQKLINEGEKDLILSDILKDANKGYFSGVSGYAGFKSAFLNFVREIKENSLGPLPFKDVLKGIQTGNAHTPINLKCNELVTLYERYQHALNKKGLMDREDFLAQALSQMNKDTFSEVELLLIDGFHDYTQLELKFIKELTSLIPNVYVTLPYQISDPVPPAFQVSHKTYSRLAGLNLQELRLDENRRTSCSILKHIESGIFTQPEDPVVPEPDISCTSLRITAAANMQDEVEQIARMIRKLTYRDGYTFSQIAVIFRNIEKYRDIVEDTFTRFSIPVRIYGKKPLKDNPLIKVIINTTQCFTDKWQDEAVWKVLKSNTGIDGNLINKLEQEYLKRGSINDYNKWLKLTSSPELKDVNYFLKELKKIFTNLGGRHTFSYYCKWYVDIVTIFYNPAFTEENPNREISGLMKSDAGALKEFMAILNNTTLGKLSEISKDTGNLTFGKFNHILGTQVALSSYRETDKRQEVVNVINVLEARQWEMPVIFVGGLLEKEFPRQVREDLFLKDFHRKKLNATGNIVLREASEQMDEERYLFYISVTRAKERLYLSYPSANSNGNLTLPSFFLSDTQKLFPEEILQGITIQRNLSKIIPEPEDIITSTDSKNFVYYHLNNPYVSEREEKDIALWLYNNNTENKASLREELCTLTTLIESYNNLKLKFFDKKIVKKISETSTRFSPTKLKDYAQCPYKYFGRSTLKLRQAIPKSMDLLMQGTIIHKVLEEYFKDTGETKDITGIFEDVFNQETRGMVTGFEELKARNEMLNTLLTFESMEKESNLPTFKPSMFEAKFGDEELETLKIGDGDKGGIEISGKIDRVDVSEVNGEKVGIIIDYKYGQTEFRLTELEEGLDLQLPIYILALRDVFRVIPVAAEFYALKTSRKTGIYNQELIEELKLNIKPARKSLSVDNKEFNKRLKDAENHILKFSQEIRNGRIELAPANIDFCGEGNCDFANVCRIDKWRLR